MKSWLRWACAAATLTVASSAMAADHRDAPGTKADPTTDINDVYAFVDGGKLILAMTVFPVAEADAAFSDAVQYVFNIDTGAGFPVTTESTKVVCTFAADQTATCYLGMPGQPSTDYVTGDAKGEAGVTSESGMFQVFAGMRADPFFFNLEGFTDAVSTVIGAAPTLTFDEANCPDVNLATSAVLVDQLQSTMQGAGPAQDFFLALNTLSIVASIDLSLFNPEHNTLSVWASTHRVQ
jgi:hypothetical protein